MDNNLKHEKGPFNIIGDVHGCFEELTELLSLLKYTIHKVEDNDKNYGFVVTHSTNEKIVFVGDLVDKGPQTPKVLRLVMSMVNSGLAYCVAGNHDDQLLKKLSGEKVSVKKGLLKSLEQLALEPPDFIEKVKKFLTGLPSHYLFDGGNLVVAHTGIKEEMQGTSLKKTRSFCIYGEKRRRSNKLSLRFKWAMKYKGDAMVVYGHTPVPEPFWLNNTIDIDTGCVYGGKLVAFRYPGRELVMVPALQVHHQPPKLFNVKPNKKNFRRPVAELFNEKFKEVFR